MTVQIDTNELTPDYRDMAVRLLKRQLLAESATAELFGDAIRLGPTWRDRVRQAEFTEEEADHVRICAEVLEALGADVDEILAQRGNAGEFFGAKKTGFDSWIDVIAFNLIGDRAGTAQIRAYHRNSLDAWGGQIDKILRDESRHQSYGADQSIELCQDPELRRQMQATVDRILPPTVKRAFGRLDGEENEYCLRVGLKNMTTEEVQMRYFDSLAPIMERAGLRFPDFTAQGVVLAPSVKQKFGLN
ncbi:MAG: Phenylacetic acid catabolic protein [Burkholderiaceae bacterium]